MGFSNGELGGMNAVLGKMIKCCFFVCKES